MWAYCHLVIYGSQEKMGLACSVENRHCCRLKCSLCNYQQKRKKENIFLEGGYSASKTLYLQLKDPLTVLDHMFHDLTII